jgi:tRNA 5-methylaminomethyl-2-thiouridine biosynthesis bifunctional protein
MRADAQFDPDGRLTSTLYGDVYFSGDGISETEHVFVRGNQLIERFQATRGTFVIGETGFGTGLNFLVAAQCFRQHAPPTARLVFVTTEQHLLSAELLAAVHAKLPERMQAEASTLRAALAQSAADGSRRIHFDNARIVLHLLAGDATATLQAHTFAADAWFLDGFSPARNPAMWSFELLREVAKHSTANGTFATYTVAGAVRRALQDAGFAIERAAGHGKKREMLRGTRKPFEASRNAPRLLPQGAAPIRHVHVLGAGIAAASAAHTFAARGANVTVIAPQGIADGASGIAAAIVRPRLWVEGAGRVPDAEILAQAFRFTRAWLQQSGDEHFRATGALLCATDAADAHRLAKRAANSQTLDLATWLNAEDASQRGGTMIPHGAAWLPTAGTCNLAGLSRELLQHDNIEVRRDAPSDQADLRVLATAHANDLANGALPTQVVRGQAIAVQWPLACCAPEVVLCTSGYLSPRNADGLTWIGSTFDRDNSNREPSASDDARVRQHFAALPEIADALSHAVTQRRFAALRHASKDRLPMIGGVRQSDHPCTVASLAHGSRGAVTAPWAAELLVRAAFGEPLAVSDDYWQRLAPYR